MFVPSAYIKDIVMNPIINVIAFILLWKILDWWIHKLHLRYIKWQVERDIKKNRKKEQGDI